MTSSGLGCFGLIRAGSRSELISFTRAPIASFKFEALRGDFCLPVEELALALEKLNAGIVVGGGIAPCVG